MITTSTNLNSNFTPQVIIIPNFPTSTPILGASSYYHPGPGFKISISSDTKNNDWYINVYQHDVSITNIDIKVIAKKGNSQGTLFNDYEEKDGYTFSIKKINEKTVYKNVDVESEYDYTQFKYEIKLINSPHIRFNNSNNPPDLYVKFHIYYTFNGEEKRTTLYRKIMEANGVNIGLNNEEIKYNSISYTDRINWVNTLKLDSFYRPFFFNTALLFSGSTAQLFFSIANGCTYRQDNVVDLNSPQAGLQTRYEIGDINLKISHHNEKGVVENGNMYELIIKDNYRNFSEIRYDNDDDTIKEAHIRGIRGNGIYLPKIDNTKNLDVLHIYDNDVYKYSPKKTEYYNSEYKFTTDYSNDNIISSTSGVCEEFTTSGYGLNVSFSVNDGSPDGVSYKTIGVEYNDIRFPNIIKKTHVYKEKKEISFDYKMGWNDNIRYFYSYDEKTFISRLKKINVDDAVFFSDLTKNLEELYFEYKENKSSLSIIVDRDIDKVLAIYFNNEDDFNEEEDDEGNEEDKKSYKYKKDTSKLLIIRIYDLDKNG